MKNKPDLSGYKYSPQTGLIYRNRPSGIAKAGPVMNRTKKHKRISINGEIWDQHRIAFYFMGKNPPPTIKHLNGKKDDNRWENLSNYRYKKQRKTYQLDLSGFKYFPKSGLIYRNKRMPGLEPGFIGSNASGGYRASRINGTFWLHHRVAFHFMGIDPKGKLVDHINGIRHDNRWDNLRLVTYGENSLNLDCHRNGKIPYISYRNNGKWVVYAKRQHHGQFKTQEEAFHHAQKIGLYD